MNEALQKTLELILIILIGYFLQKKLPDKQSLKGIKTLILSVALPATIFLALLKIKLESSLLFLPLLALSFNLAMLAFSWYVLPFFFKSENEASQRTRSMLLPSLAPGLSCFPFIIAYLGEDELAIAALADVGNKFFGLILLFILATVWYRKRSVKKEQSSPINKIKDLLFSLGSEPINLVIGIAIILLIFGFNESALPLAIQNTVGKLSMMMVPLILLFIGLSVRIGISDFIKMVQLLSWRSGLAFMLSAVALMVWPGISVSMALLLIVFPQSSCSFWPYAHMCTVSNLEEKEGQNDPTFHQEFAINILACSLPFSTCIIIFIFYIGEVLINPVFLLTLGIVLLLSTVIIRVFVFVCGNLVNKSKNLTFSKIHHSIKAARED